MKCLNVGVHRKRTRRLPATSISPGLSHSGHSQLLYRRRSTLFGLVGTVLFYLQTRHSWITGVSLSLDILVVEIMPVALYTILNKASGVNAEENHFLG